MNQNLTYTYTSDPRSGQSSQQSQQTIFHPSNYQTTYTTSTSAPYSNNNGSTFIPNSSTIQVQQSRIPQALRLSVDGDDKRISQLMDSSSGGTTYFLDVPAPSTSGNWNSSGHGQTIQVQTQPLQTVSAVPPQITYQNGQLIAQPLKIEVLPKLNISADKAEKERLKKARQAEAARLRYHRLTPEEKRELNLKRTLAQKRKRQREKEMEELDSILRETNDIQEDPDITEQLREKRMRAKWAEAARARYARMTPEERRAHNNRRRMRQMQNALAAVKAAGGSGDPVKDEEAVRQHIKTQNAKKAEAARMRYHRMTEEEKRIYNQRRTEAFRRRRMEEEMLLAMPIGRINGEALDRAQQIVVRNAKRAEAARARYQRMTPDQRKSYNQKRYTPKRRSQQGMIGDILPGLSQSTGGMITAKKDEFDALSTLEREVLKRTQVAQQALVRQGQRASTQLLVASTPQQPPTSNTYIIQQAPGQLGSQQIQIAPSASGHQQILHVSQHPMQQIQTAPQGHTIIAQPQSFQIQSQPTSQSHVVVQHQTSAGSIGNIGGLGSSHVVLHQPSHQREGKSDAYLLQNPKQDYTITYTTSTGNIGSNGGNMMISGQQQHVQQSSVPSTQQQSQSQTQQDVQVQASTPQSQQVLNPYGAPQRT